VKSSLQAWKNRSEAGGDAPDRLNETGGQPCPG